MCDRHSGEEIMNRDTPVSADVGQDVIIVVDGWTFIEPSPYAAKLHYTLWETSVYQQDGRAAVDHHNSVNFL